MNYKVVLFDADGVLIKKKFLFSERLQERYGIDSALLQPFFKGVFADCRIGKADLKEELERVVADWGWKGSVEELTEFWFTEGTKIEEDLLAVAQDLHDQGVHVSMVTDQEKYRAASVEERVGNGKPFETIFFSGNIGCVKKESRFFETVYQELRSKLGSIDKVDVLVIDDGEDNIAVAEEFGFRGHVFTDLEDLKSFLYA